MTRNFLPVIPKRDGKLSERNMFQISEEKSPFPCDQGPSRMRRASWKSGVAFVVMVDKTGS